MSLVESSTRKLTLDNIYVVIKDILDGLKRYKDAPYGVLKKRFNNEDTTTTTNTNPSSTPGETEEEKRRNSRLRKVDQKMKQISDKIKELQTAEVDLDDEDNSAYLVEERLKKQFSKLHDYYCKLAQCSTATGRPIERKIKYTGSRWTEINKRISAWVNKNKEFPDYLDILNLVKKVTKESSLPLRPETVRVQAQEIFHDIGKVLKERRESDDLYNIYSYGDDETDDPANTDTQLNQKLIDNESIAKDKLEKVFQEFVDKDTMARETADKNINQKKKDKIIDEGNMTKENKNGDEKMEMDNSDENREQKKNSDDENRNKKKNCDEKLEQKKNNDDENRKKKNSDDENREQKKNSDDENRNEKKNSDDKVEENGERENEEEEEEVDNERYEVDDDDDSDDNDTEEIEGEKRESDIDKRLSNNNDNNDDNGVNNDDNGVNNDDGDETDDDLKQVLANACIEEEEEDSEEDVEILDDLVENGSECVDESCIVSLIEDDVDQ
ncbi:hypothetical protein Pcinc_036355, partial [Petrolisthes cinctipes]